MTTTVYEFWEPSGTASAGSCARTRRSADLLIRLDSASCSKSFFSESVRRTDTQLTRRLMAFLRISSTRADAWGITGARGIPRIVEVRRRRTPAHRSIVARLAHLASKQLNGRLEDAVDMIGATSSIAYYAIGSLLFLKFINNYSINSTF